MKRYAGAGKLVVARFSVAVHVWDIETKSLCVSVSRIVPFWPESSRLACAPLT